MVRQSSSEAEELHQTAYIVASSDNLEFGCIGHIWYHGKEDPIGK